MQLVVSPSHAFNKNVFLLDSIWHTLFKMHGPLEIWMCMIKAILQDLRSNSIVERPSSWIGKFLQHNLFVIFGNSCQRLVVLCSTNFLRAYQMPLWGRHLTILSDNYSCIVPTLVRLLHCAVIFWQAFYRPNFLSMEHGAPAYAQYECTSKSWKNCCRRELCEQGLSFTSDESNATIGRRRVNLSQLCFTVGLVANCFEDIRGDKFN